MKHSKYSENQPYVKIFEKGIIQNPITKNKPYLSHKRKLIGFPPESPQPIFNNRNHAIVSYSSQIRAAKKRKKARQ